jgi:hypothetical protein
VLSRAGGLRENASGNDITIVRVVGGKRLELEAYATTGLQPGDVVVVAPPGPLRLKPRVGLQNVGYDSNIHHDATNAMSDFIATFSGGLDASVRSTRLSVEGRGAADLRYFHTHQEQRSLDTRASGRLAYGGNRFLPYGEGAFDHAPARDHWDVNRRLQRTRTRVEAGGAVRLTRSTTVTPSAGHLQVNYAPTGYPLDEDRDTLSLLAHTAFTTLTAGELTVSAERSQFPSAHERDSSTLAILPAVVFDQFAIVSGRATAGYKQLTFDAPPLRDFRGMVGNVELSRAVSDRARLTFSGGRDLFFSGDRTSGYYTFSAVGVGITYWMTRSWRVDTGVGRQWLHYAPIPGESPRVDDGLTLGARLRRQLARTTAFDVGIDYQRRRSMRATQAFDALVVETSVTYAP